MFESRGLPYHSPHKFRHGFAHYGQERSMIRADYKAVSQNLMHSSTKITDETYSNLNDGEVENRIGSLGKDKQPEMENQEIIDLFKEFMAWKRKRK